MDGGLVLEDPEFLSPLLAEGAATHGSILFLSAGVLDEFAAVHEQQCAHQLFPAV